MPGGLGADHWKVILFIRNAFMETGEYPLVYQTCKANGLTSKTFKDLFHTGYLRGAQNRGAAVDISENLKKTPQSMIRASATTSHRYLTGICSIPFSASRDLIWPWQE